MRVFAAMGQEPTDEELFDMIAEVDSDGSGEIGADALICAERRPAPPQLARSNKSQQPPDPPGLPPELRLVRSARPLTRTPLHLNVKKYVYR